MSSITIKQLIAHDLNLKNEKPFLLDKTINLSGVPQVVFDFFQKHIENSLNARQIKACTFADKDTYVQNKVIKIYNNINDERVFISETREMATDLFIKMKATSTKSDGTLFFMIYNKESEDYLAIMKMDPNKGIQINKKDYSLKVQENMLPNPEDKLHKCAFIKLTSDFSNEQVHLHILDRQQKPGEVSKFFMMNFLQAHEIMNDEIMTKRVINKLNEQALSIVPKESDILDFQFKVDQMFKNGMDVDLDYDLEKLVKPFIKEEKERADFIENFKKSLRDEFEDVKFQFKVVKKPTIVSYQSKGKEIKIEFPIGLKGSKIFIHKEDNELNIRIKDIELEEKFK